MRRILLGQLEAGGDCLYTTILAHQLRKDYPDAEIWWAISPQCINLLENNPYIDKAWQIDCPDWSHHEMVWRVFHREALRLYERREFDLILLSQIWPNNFQNYDGTIRSSILRSYGAPITVPIENTIRLTEKEIERVEDFAREHRLADNQHRILFECSAKSGQSFVTPDIAQDIADAIYRRLPDARVILSTHLPMTLRDDRSVYTGTLTLREIAHLTRHASLFVGTGSGGTVAASSTASALLPMVQLIKSSTSVFASFAHDFEYFGKTERPVLEITNEDTNSIAEAIAATCLHGIANARQQYASPVQIDFAHYLALIETYLIGKHRFLDAARSLQITAERYGWAPALVDFARKRVAPRLAQDPSAAFSINRSKMEIFLDELDAAREGGFRRAQRLWHEGSRYSSFHSKAQVP